MGGGHKRNTENGMCCLCAQKVNDPSDQKKKNSFFFFFNQLHTGLFDTITSTSKSKDCPGRCVHVLAALLCEKVINFTTKLFETVSLFKLFHRQVLENVSCSEASMRCCVENRPAPPARSVTTKPPSTNGTSPAATSSASTATSTAQTTPSSTTTKASTTTATTTTVATTTTTKPTTQSTTTKTSNEFV